jgi:hypothetical protein
MLFNFLYQFILISSRLFSEEKKDYLQSGQPGCLIDIWDIFGELNYTLTQEHGVFLEMNGTPDTEETLEVVEEQEQHFREQQVNII